MSVKQRRAGGDEKALEQGEGIRQYWRRPRSKDVPLPATTAEICNTKDIVCDFAGAHFGEHEGDPFDAADSAINAVASGVGATGLSLNDDSYDDGDDITL